MSITMNIHIQDGAVRISGSDIELANAIAKAAFDRTFGAIGSTSHIPPVADCNTHTDDWEDDADWDEKDNEQDKIEELKKTVREMFGSTLGVAILSELAERNSEEREKPVEKLKRIFGQ